MQHLQSISALVLIQYAVIGFSLAGDNSFCWRSIRDPSEGTRRPVSCISVPLSFLSFHLLSVISVQQTHGLQFTAFDI